MLNDYNSYPCSYCAYGSRGDFDDTLEECATYPCPYYYNQLMYNPDIFRQYDEQYFSYANEIDYDPMYDYSRPVIAKQDFGPAPYVANIEADTKRNRNYRNTLWTGNHLQLTLMSIKVGEDIGLEVHPSVDQFIRIEEGTGVVEMGPNKNNLNFRRQVIDGFAIFIPSGTWHNVINTGNRPLKLYSIYAPPNHPHGTVQATKPIGHD